MNITAGSAEHKALVSEFYKGNDGNFSQTDINSLDTILTAAKVLNFIPGLFHANDNFTLYAAAAQQCDKVRCLLVTLLNKIA